MKKISYNCKFCKRPGVAEYSEEMVRDVTKWVPMLACNPCADYMTHKNRIKQHMRNVCINLLTSRLNKSKKLNAVEADARERLAVMTRNFAKLVCNYHRCTLIWEPEFIDQLLGSPDRSDYIAEFYSRNVPKMIKTTANCAVPRSVVEAGK